MTLKEKIEKLIAEKKKELGKKIDGLPSDFQPDDYAGGNIDDAFYCGMSWGEAGLVAELIEMMEETTSPS